MSFSEDSKPRTGATDALVEIRDYSLWVKHIRGNRELVRQLESVRAGGLVYLSIDGHRGVWQKKEDGSNGLPTQGLKPLGEMRELWFRWFRERRGEMVKIVLEQALAGSARTSRASSARIPLEYPTASKAEQEAAWEAFKQLRHAGWRSSEPYGSRDELHER
jgi:hypothetical protein